MSKSQQKMSISLQHLSRALILDFHKLSYVTSLQINRCNLVIANLRGMPHIATVELTISTLATSYDVQNASKNGHLRAMSVIGFSNRRHGTPPPPVKGPRGAHVCGLTSRLKHRHTSWHGNVFGPYTANGKPFVKGVCGKMFVLPGTIGRIDVRVTKATEDLKVLSKKGRVDSGPPTGGGGGGGGRALSLWG